MTKTYGIDIAARRADDLDKLITGDIEQNNNPKVLDIGCGAGAQSFRMQKAGALVTGVDLKDGCELVSFIQGDIKNVVLGFKKNQFDLCLIQRTIHYLKYNEAVLLLKKLREIIKSELYISASGAESDLRLHYKNIHKKIEQRFFSLDREGQRKFQINQPLCLYTKEEFIDLLEKTGWKIEKCWTSAFGNHKAKCS